MNVIRNAKVLTAVVCATALFGCQTGASSASAAGSKTETGKKEGAVLAEVNGVTITTADLALELKNLPEHLRSRAGTDQGRKDMLDSMVIRELILQQAAKEGVDKNAEVVEKLQDLKKRLIVETFLRNKVETGVRVSDANLKEFYERNREKFQVGEQVRASHILLKSEKEAKEILEQLNTGGNFEELAKKSACRDSASKGGDLGWFGKGVMVPVFEQAALALKEGEVSDVVKTARGFHIIKLTGKRPAGVRPFGEVKEQVKAAVLPSKQKEVLQKIREELKKNARIVIM